MPARLFCKTGELAGSSFSIGEEAIIGRQSRNEVTLHPSFVSGQHARITYDAEAGCYLIEDLNSSNGTAVDGIPVTEPVRLGPLHVITFADQLDFIFQVLTEPLRPAPAAPAEPETAAPEIYAPEIASAEVTPEAAPEAKTRLGDPFAPPPNVPTEEEKTRLGDPFAPLPQTPTEAPAPEEATRLGDPFAPPPSVPTEEEKTRLGDPFAPLPVPAAEQEPEETVAEKSSAEPLQEEAPKTRLGDPFAPLPSFQETITHEEPPPTAQEAADATPDAPAPEETRLGDPFGALPPIPATPSVPDEATVMQQPAPAAAPHFALRVKMPDGTHFDADLQEGENVVGRESSCDVPIRDAAVSRRHAIVTVTGDRVTLRDLGSKNFTYLHGRRLAEETPLAPGTPIRFGLEVEAELLRS